MYRNHNFNPGPAVLPLLVLEEVQASLLDYQGSGMSVMEMSHRSPLFDAIITDAEARIRRLMNIDDRFHVLFIQGGASMQFAMAPMNLLGKTDTADYVNTGTWSTKAMEQARIQNKQITCVASSEADGFSYIPTDISFTPGAVYAYITSNNTVRGTQWADYPDTGGIPLVADMCSDILSRPIDMEKFGLVFAGAQKNMGPAGVCIVIVRDDLLSRPRPTGLPTLLDYATYVEKRSLFNTPPCFSIYVIQLVLTWLEETIGGLAAMETLNREKAGRLYNRIDKTDFYTGTARKDSRSLMNVTFRLPSEKLEQAFVAQALDAGFIGLKGHKSAGGCRASVYNATPMASVEALIAFMNEFERKNG
ncbi:MAG: 3-phosphoserine/phosphohydroxythreonine aminotransferase [Deltaproteobacteria bacterium]|nr:MAG: 3-phosphoserine/phosphohydroxythreonine aminotransferase [Deltaproteobacteria bacterium]